MHALMYVIVTFPVAFFLACALTVVHRDLRAQRDRAKMRQHVNGGRS
jgi:hypothetical protein